LEVASASTTRSYAAIAILQRKGERGCATRRSRSRCSVAVTLDNLLIESHGRGFDGVSAAWDALAAAEQTRRELRAADRHESDHLAAS